jgi:hypothetical protein
VKAVNKEINVAFDLENCAEICLKEGRVQSRPTHETRFRKLGIRKLYLGIEES